MVLGTDTEILENHSQLPKKAYKCSAQMVANFSYVWRPRPSLHRESTNSLIMVKRGQIKGEEGSGYTQDALCH